MRSLGVFCGSRAGTSPLYAESARAAGERIARRGLTLVYGGASVGLMGELADAALAAGGRVVGVLPRFLADREIAHGGLTELRLVDTMHERKRTMVELSDAFVVLPGGPGTLDETFEVVTWLSLGLHRSPCALLNVAGFYDRLLEFLAESRQAGFFDAGLLDRLVVDEDLDVVLDRLAAQALPHRVAHLRGV
ncbi:MAG: TIGR00730 family Rossman fold protein [Limisphaerales bacterium]